jgi:hypothetical protein
MDAIDVVPPLPQLDLPGGDDFHDITGLFNAAAAGMCYFSGSLWVLFLVQEMEPGSVILMDGFSLQDAMSAFEASKLACNRNMF